MKKASTVLIILSFIFLSCGGKDKVKPSADSLLATEAIKSINIIKIAYQEKNKDILQNHLDSVIAESVLKELFFDKAELSFTPRMVQIDASIVMVNLNWQGTWLVKGNSLKNRGVAVLLFEGSPMKLIRVDGDSPFHIPFVIPEQKNKESAPAQDIDEKQTAIQKPPESNHVQKIHNIKKKGNT